MIRIVALALALAAGPAAVRAQPVPPPSAPVATLTVSDDDGAQYLVALAPAVQGSGFFDFLLTVDCTGACPAPLHYQEAYNDVPLGLFQLREADPLVYSVGVGGIGYRVRAWSVAKGKVAKVLEATSRGAPEFFTAADGRPAVRVFQSSTGGKPTAPAVWTLRGDAFAKAAPPARRR